MEDTGLLYAVPVSLFQRGRKELKKTEKRMKRVIRSRGPLTDEEVTMILSFLYTGNRYNHRWHGEGGQGALFSYYKSQEAHHEIIRQQT